MRRKFLFSDPPFGTLDQQKHKVKRFFKKLRLILCAFFIQSLTLLCAPLFILIMIYACSVSTLLWSVGMMIYGFYRDDLHFVKMMKPFISSATAHFSQGIVFFFMMIFIRAYLGDYIFALYFECIEEYLSRFFVSMTCMLLLQFALYALGFHYMPTIIIINGISANCLQYFSKIDQILSCDYLQLPLNMPGFLNFTENNFPEPNTSLSSLSFDEYSSWDRPLFYSFFLINVLSGYHLFKLDQYVTFKKNKRNKSAEGEKKMEKISDNKEKEPIEVDSQAIQGAAVSDEDTPKMNMFLNFFNAPPKEGSFLLNIDDCFLGDRKNVKRLRKNDSDEKGDPGEPLLTGIQFFKNKTNNAIS